MKIRKTIFPHKRIQQKRLGLGFSLASKQARNTRAMTADARGNCRLIKGCPIHENANSCAHTYIECRKHTLRQVHFAHIGEIYRKDE